MLGGKTFFKAGVGATDGMSLSRHHGVLTKRPRCLDEETTVSW